MGKRKISGSSIVINNEIHFKGRNTEFRSKGAACTPIGRDEIVEPVRVGAFAGAMMGAVPVSGGGETSPWEQKVLGSTAAAAGILVKQDPQTGECKADYAPSLLKVVDGAYAKNGALNEEDGKKLSISVLGRTLETAKPAYYGWNQVLAEAMEQETLAAALKGTQPAGCVMFQDTVNVNTGNYVYEKEALAVQGPMPLSFRQVYNRMDTRKGCMGKGWRHNYEICLLAEADRYVLLWGDGREEVFMRGKDEKPKPLSGGTGCLKRQADSFLYETYDGQTYTFDETGRFLRQKDLNQQGVELTYDAEGRLSRVSNGHGGSLTYQYDPFTGMLARVSDHTGRQVRLAYELGCLKEVTDPGEGRYSYYYQGEAVFRIHDPRDIDTIENQYDVKGRVVKQTFADGRRTMYDYQEDLNRTLVTEENGNKTAYVHDERFRNVKTICADGDETFRYNNRGQLIEHTDKKGNKIGQNNG